ncbi:MAG TPA: hypothetical protein VF331_13975 [Polyangiales bacterium]
MYISPVINTVEITRSAKKDLRGCPRHVRVKLAAWVVSIESIGLEQTRRLGGKGLHDEALAGDREGQRSVRLNRGYRAFYVIKDGEVQLVSVIEVNKHEY